MFTTLFLGAALIAPPPFPPLTGFARARPYSRDPRKVAVFVSAHWRPVPEMQEMVIRWNPDGPPGVLLVDCVSQTTPPRTSWSGPGQLPSFSALPWASPFEGQFREVWFRDVYGRILMKAPVENVR